MREIKHKIVIDGEKRDIEIRPMDESFILIIVGGQGGNNDDPERAMADNAQNLSRYSSKCN